MSLVFNAIGTDYKGIVQVYEKEIGVNRGEISGDTDKLKELTADINLALDDFTVRAITSGGTWQYDDSNNTVDYPIIKCNLIANQRDYPFLLDEQGNLILDIYRVFARISSTGAFQEIFPIDVQTEKDITSFIDGLNTTGIPIRYDKTGNGIFLDPIPSYNSTLGLMVYINRESSYFTYTDTTRKPGVPGLFHKYFALKPALDYARRHSLASYNRLAAEVLAFEGDEDKGIIGSIARYFGRRERDIKRRLKANVENTK